MVNFCPLQAAPFPTQIDAQEPGLFAVQHAENHPGLRERFHWKQKKGRRNVTSRDL